MINKKVISLNWSPFLPHQAQFFLWDSPERLTIEAILGGYGSGKTSAAARKFVKRALALGWSDEYGDRRPQCVAIAPTARILKRVVMPAVEELIPRAAILKKRLAPDKILTLHNGVDITFVSGEAEFEGENLALIWVDEINNETFARNPQRYINYLARLRDKHAAKLCMIVSGLPESGWVRETFDTDAPGKQTILCGTKDNPYVPKETIAAIMASCPLGFEDAYIKGAWMHPPDAVFSQYDAGIHLVDLTPDVSKPVSLGIDVGNHGAVVIAQPYKNGVLICDQIITRDISVEEMCLRFRHHSAGWHLDKERSCICVDPTIRRDELEVIRRTFPTIRIIRRERDHELYAIEAGVRILQAGLRDASGNTRLFFARSLAREKYGVIDAILSARRHTFSQRVVKDDSRDHALDALRYVAQEMLRPRATGVTLIPR